MLAHVLGQALSDPVPAGVADLCDTLTALINGSKRRIRAVMQLTVDGYSQGEIADMIRVEIGDVENARYLFRKKVRALERHGELHVPPEVRAEWRRGKNRMVQR